LTNVIKIVLKRISPEEPILSAIEVIATLLLITKSSTEIVNLIIRWYEWQRKERREGE
jgi:hypothetical protein